MTLSTLSKINHSSMWFPLIGYESKMNFFKIYFYDIFVIDLVKATNFSHFQSVEAKLLWKIKHSILQVVLTIVSQWRSQPDNLVMLCKFSCVHISVKTMNF